MNTDIHTLLTAALQLGGIDTTKAKDLCYEVWLRHLDDEDEFLYGQGWDTPTAEQMLHWAYSVAVDIECEPEYERAERAICRKFILGLWKVRNEHDFRSILHISGDWSLEFDFIDKHIAKTLPDGHTQTYQIWNRVHTRHIKGGKWHKGPYTK